MTARILIVDDDPMILLAFRTLLEGPAMQIETADSLEAARDQMSREHYSAVITDLRLSGVHGQEGLEVIRDLKRLSPDTRIILMTAYGNAELQEEVKRLGADLYLEKPVATSDLRRMLAELGVI